MSQRADASKAPTDSKEVGEQLNKQDNASVSDDFEVENGESESDDEDEDLDECEDQDESEEMGMFMGMRNQYIELPVGVQMKL